MNQSVGLIPLASVSLVGLIACATSDEVAPEAAAEVTARDALYNEVQVVDAACSVVANGVHSTQTRSLRVTLRAMTIPGALTATVTSLEDPSLSVTATFDGVWNTFDGSAHTASGTWLDVRGRMTGNALTMSYAGRKAALPDGTVPGVQCLALVGTATFSLPAPVQLPPATWCEEPVATSTGIHATLRVDKYEGIQVGTNVHEFARATITSLPWIYDAQLIDTMHVELAMRVGADSGLPHEIPLVVGQLIQVEGEYIPASVANAPNANGQLDAVIHYTHAECGYAVIAGSRYN